MKTIAMQYWSWTKKHRYENFGK